MSGIVISTLCGGIGCGIIGHCMTTNKERLDRLIENRVTSFF